MNTYRQLNIEEILKLIENDNCAIPSNWSEVFVHVNFNLNQCDFIQGSRFKGKCFLGQFNYPPNEDNQLLFGIKNTTITNCIIQDNVNICDNLLIKNVEIEHDSNIIGCGYITYHSGKCGELSVVKVGCEKRNRKIRINTQLTPLDISNWLLNNEELPQIDILRRTKSTIRPYSTLINCALIQNVNIGDYSYINNSSIKNSTLISTIDNPVIIDNNVEINNCIVYNSHIKNYVVIENSLLSMNCVISSNSTISHSIIGSSCTINGGDVFNSLFGEKTTINQSAYIKSVIAPYGKVIISYNSQLNNITNLNCQNQNIIDDIWLGEGLYIDNNTNLYNQLSLFDSNYTIINNNVTLFSQLVSFPFSLIRLQSKSNQYISPSYNEIIPAWILAHGQYIFLRNLKKSQYLSEFINDRVLESMINSYNSLSQVSGKDIYTDEDIPVLGRNFLTEENRLKAIDTYLFFITYSIIEKMYTYHHDICQNPDNNITSLSDIDLPSGAELIRDKLNFSFDELPYKYLEYRENILNQAISSNNRENIKCKNLIPDFDNFFSEIQYEKIITTEREEINKLKSAMVKNNHVISLSENYIQSNITI